MKFSENWLRQHVPTDATRDELAATLTAIGLEVEEVDRAGRGARRRRRRADRRAPRSIPKPTACRSARSTPATATPCRSSAARRTRAPGLKAPLATVGATLPGGMAIKAAKLRGVESDGMLCSAKELGLDADASGLLELPADAPVGAPLADYLGLPDATHRDSSSRPNRADCFSVRGIAFDVAAACGSEVVAVRCRRRCPRSTTRRWRSSSTPAPMRRATCGRVIEGVDASQRDAGLDGRAPAPQRHAPDQSLLVDVTQYVMLELGQPMHAFDRDTAARARSACAARAPARR